MKKTALTIGLFSLVMVATTFAAPQTTTSTSVSVSMDTDGTGGGAAGGVQKKVDRNDVFAQSSSNGRINQSLGGNKKID